MAKIQIYCKVNMYEHLTWMEDCIHRKNWPKLTVHITCVYQTRMLRSSWKSDASNKNNVPDALCQRRSVQGKDVILGQRIKVVLSETLNVKGLADWAHQLKFNLKPTT